MGILRAWELLRSGLTQREPQCAEERVRQPLIWNPLVRTEQGHMFGTRPRLAWGPLAHTATLHSLSYLSTNIISSLKDIVLSIS